MLNKTSLVSSDPDTVSPGLIVGIEENTKKENGLLLPGVVVTIRFAVPEGVPAGTLIVAKAEVEFITFTLVTLRLLKPPEPAVIVIGAPKRAPVNVTGTDVPAAANGGLMNVSDGNTLMEIV